MEELFVYFFGIYIKFGCKNPSILTPLDSVDFVSLADLTILIGPCACLKALNSKRPQTFRRVAVVDYITKACPPELRSLALLQWS